MMDISEYEYLWTTQKKEYVLVNGNYGYSIVDVSDHTAMLFGNEALEKAIIEKMLAEGNTVYENIREAFGLDSSK